MCLINCRPAQPEPEVVVPNRPVHIPVSISPQPTQPAPALAHSRGSHSSQISARPLSVYSNRQQSRLEPPSRRQSQVIVIEQRTPRSSSFLPAQLEGNELLSSGSMAVARRHSQSKETLPDGRRSVSSMGVETLGASKVQPKTRRSGSLVYGRDPRASNASWRSTRERVVVVDGQGIRREYIR